eukprot:5687284-Heterocapsa_arctica.AAC.1
MDDPLWCIVGTRRDRQLFIALVMLTLCALGVRMSWGKAQRGHEIIWIGVQFKLNWDSKLLVLEIPLRMLQELQADLE